MRSMYPLLTLFLALAILFLGTGAADDDYDIHVTDGLPSDWTDVDAVQAESHADSNHAHQPPPINSSSSSSYSSPNSPEAADSRHHVLVVAGSLEYYVLLAGATDKQLLELAAANGAKDSPTFIRLTGAAVCLDKSGDWRRWPAPPKGTVREAKFYTVTSGPGVSTTSITHVSVSAEGVFLVPNAEKPAAAQGNESEQYLKLTHNCTDTGEVVDERFNLSSFAEHQLERYSTLSQGFVFIPFSSHDTAFTRSMAEVFAYAKYYSRGVKKGVPQTMFVEGEASGGGSNSKQPAGSLKVVGRLYNWDYDDMPEPAAEAIDEAFINSTRVPLNFEGRVKVGVVGNATCHGVRLELYRADRKIMSGSTHSANGQFQLYAENGGLLELMEPLSDWYLMVEHTCNSEWVLREQMFRLVPDNERFGPQEKYLKAAKLEPVS